MAKSVEMTFTISEEGEVEFHIEGIQGSGCEDLAHLLNDLGEKVQEKNTSEYYQQQIDTAIATRYKK